MFIELALGLSDEQLFSGTAHFSGTAQKKSGFPIGALAVENRSLNPLPP